MKNKKIVVITVTVAVILAVFGTIMVIQANRKPGEAVTHEINADAEQTRTLEAENNIDPVDGGIALAKDKTELTYKETVEILSEVRRDVYTDDDDNEYWYDADGHIMMFSGNYLAQNIITAGYSDGAAQVSEQDAREIADAFAQALFGKEICGAFSFNSVSENKEDGVRTFIYADKRGIVVFADIGVSVLPDGSVQRAVLNRNYYECADFDKTVLDGVTERQLLDFAKDQLDKSELTMSGAAQLIKKDGKYCVLFTVGYDDTNAQVYYEL